MLPETLVFAIAMLITGAILFLLIYFVSFWNGEIDLST